MRPPFTGVRSPALALLALLLGAALLPAPGRAAEGPDPLLPRSGSDAYDVERYEVRLFYRPGADLLAGTVRIEGRARRELRELPLDLYGLRVLGATVNGEPAGVARGRGKLRLRPARAPVAGEPFTAVVRYRGRPRLVRGADEGLEGWAHTEDGALTMGQPVGTATWLPCNNTPADKARFEFRLTVPARLKAVANGRLVGVERRHGLATYHWRVSEPMAPYVALVNIGRGKLRRGSAAGVPTWTLVQPDMWEESRRVLETLPEVIRFLSRAYGPYPFDAAGSVVDRAPFGYALETQTRPAYAYVPDVTTLVHETAHQWFGDSVGIERWPEIWLNEGLATWSQWWYAEHHGGLPARQTFHRLYRVPASNKRFWEPPPGRLRDKRDLFSRATYVRGAMTVEALRMRIGTRALLRTLRRWTAAHRHGFGTIPEFIELAERVSRKQLDDLFRRWLFQRGKPRL